MAEPNDGLDQKAVPGSLPELTDPEFLQELRQKMLRFAILQLRDNDLAEDAVQEALIGALKNSRSFGGRSALKTWVFAILKNKIADILRQRMRLVEVGQLLQPDDDDEGDNFDKLFDAKGFWHVAERPATWGDPEASMRDRQFWRVFEICLDHLPGQQARVFMMREFIEMETHEICSAAEVSVSNLNVMLHRARLRLRECLENGWFTQEESSC